MSKIIGYLISIIGLIIVALSSSLIQNALNITLPKVFSPLILMIAGVACVAVGIIILMGKKQSKKVEEVPIYEGKDIVGYRRLKKK